MNTELAHFNMIEQQIRPWDVLDGRVLDVLDKTPRHGFIPSQYQGLAYSEMPIPLSDKYTMLEPKVIGRFLQALNPQQNEKALVIGTGSGYLSALLAQMCSQVTSIDLDPKMTQLAEQNTAPMTLNNISFFTQNAYDLTNQPARYDIIAATAAFNQKPDAFLDKLEVGGRLVAVVGIGSAMQAVCYTRTENHQWVEEGLFETQLAYLEGERLTDHFDF